MPQFNFLVSDPDVPVFLANLQDLGWLAVGEEWRLEPFDAKGEPPLSLVDTLARGDFLRIFQETEDFVAMPVEAVIIRDHTEYRLGYGGPYASVRTVPSRRHATGRQVCGKFIIWTQSGFIHPETGTLIEDDDFERNLSEDMFHLTADCITITIGQWHWLVRKESELLTDPENWIAPDEAGKTMSEHLEAYAALRPRRR